MYKIIERTKIWFSISIIIILIGAFFMVTKGLNWGIDFKGGTVVQINMEKAFDKTAVDVIVKKHATDATSVTLNNTVLEIKSTELTTEKTNALVKELKEKYTLKADTLISQRSIEPSLGKHTRNNAIMSVVLANILILIYIAWRFEFKFGIAAIISLLHDVLVTLAFYAIFSIPIDTAFIAAILTILGYSINDTIVIFDRIRENQKFMRSSDVTELANASITQTFRRSIFTVLTVVITLAAVYVFVEPIRNFSLPLLVGIISGCYSSIYIATPTWVILKKRIKKKVVAKRI
ncbi:MAG: protein translocase subunit SecF [Clostridiaceae bacterium]|nr:protein translocase subunit SecF [Clostridiaceae bacterium]